MDRGFDIRKAFNGSLIALLLCAQCFAVSTYMGLQPGLSKRGDVEAVFGRAIRVIDSGMFEYASLNGSGKVLVEYRAKDGAIERLERRFAKPVSRAALIRSLGLPNESEEKRTNKEGQLVEYFGDIKTLAFIYAAGEEKSGVVSLGYYSMELYEQSLGLARNPTVQFDPAACKDIYFWALTERDVAKKARNPGRHQSILEISILAQRGECEKARQMSEMYKNQYR